MNSCLSSELFEVSLFQLNPQLLDWLGFIENYLVSPINSYQIHEWLENAERIADEDFQFYPEEWIVINKILDVFEEYWMKQFDMNETTNRTVTLNDDLQNKIKYLIECNQTQQRSSEWYEEHKNLLTASEIGDLFDTKATLQGLMRKKVIPRENRGQSSAVPSEYMSPFDWGIRFEPVVKQIYEYLYEAKIADLGRIYHPFIPRLAASPDGIITYSGSKHPTLVGNLIEIKCPVSRKPDGRIPPKYYHQMQLQMEVTGIDLCQFAEFIFVSKYKENWEGTPREEAWVKAVQEGAIHGHIFLIEHMNTKDKSVINTEDDNISHIVNHLSHRYEYSPINNLSWRPELDERIDHIIETIPWALLSKFQQVVAKDPNWIEMARPKIDMFWKEVDESRIQYADGKLIIQPSIKRRTDTIVQQQQQQICAITIDRSTDDKL